MTKKVTDVEAKTVAFDFEDGGDQIIIDLNNLSEAMVMRLALHGASQKGGDSYANAKKATEGTEIDPTEWSRAQVNGVLAQLVANDWTTRQAGGAGITDLATALAEAVGCPVEDAIERLSDASKEEKKELRAHPDIKVVLERIKLERQTAKAAAAEAKAGSGTDLSAFMGG